MRHSFTPTVTAILLAAAVSIPAIPALAAGGGGSDSSSATAVPSYAEAKSAADAGRYRTAIKSLNRLVKSQPKNADAWNLLGYSSRKLKKYKAAGRYYQTALKLDPKHLGALEYQGELFLETGSPERAKENLKLLKSYCGNCEEYLDLRQMLVAAGQV